MAARKKKKKKYRMFWFFAKMQLVLLLAVIAGACWYYFGGYAEEVKDLKTQAIELVRHSSKETFKANQTSIVYALDESVISTLKGGKDSYYLSITDMPSNVECAIVSIEDKKFFRHNGIDYRALLRAVKAMIENGEATQGGSTITMQLARNIFLSQEKTWQRKVEEMYIARELEKKYTKDEILEFYLNNIYFGNGYYGIQSASRGYFNRDVQDLDLSEQAFLCAIPNNPTLYDPLTNITNTYKRRNRILKNMLDDGKISKTAYENALGEVMALDRPEALAKNDYVETYTYYCAARALMETEDFQFKYQFSSEDEKNKYDEAYETLYSECQKKLYTAGYRIYTSFDLNLQQKLQDTVNEALAGYTEVNDEGVYALQSAAVCIDNDNGYVRAIVGGRSQDFSGYTLNRAFQSYRQPGSAIKPLIVYTPSFERNYTPDSVVTDEPIEDGPRNANGSYSGQITVRTAVEKSVNTIAWKLYEELTPEVGLSYLEKMNFAKLDANDYRPATALGGFTNGVSALEMASGYAAIENDGNYRAPTCIVKILDADGNEIYASAQTEEAVYKQNAARMMTDVLKGVITSGTAHGLGLGSMPAAGKTGTSNDQKDGWFVGYTRYYTTSVWVGYDMPKKMDKLMGSTYPGTIWQKFMLKAHEGCSPMEFLPYAQVSDEVHVFHPEETEENPDQNADENAGQQDQNQQPQDQQQPQNQQPQDQQQPQEQQQQQQEQQQQQQQDQQQQQQDQQQDQQQQQQDQQQEQQQQQQQEQQQQQDQQQDQQQQDQQQ